MCVHDRNRIIGGMFGLPESVVSKQSADTSKWLFLNESNLFLVNARSGIPILIDMLKPTNVWMPSYLCPTMLVGVDIDKTALRFYEVDYDLRISSHDWIDQVQAGDLVVLIDYFGFPLDTHTAHLVKERGAWVLEDACQALLSEHVGQHSDFVLFSPRKFIGVPDGGIVASCCEVTFDSIDLGPAPASWWMGMLEATINRREFDQHGGERRWYQLFRESEETAPCGYFRMSELARLLMTTAFDYQEILSRRIANYSALFAHLDRWALFPKLSSGVVPLGFPVRDKRRDTIRRYLFELRIYPPVHWSISGTVPDEFQSSCRLASHILTLPCDQRYSDDDIETMVGAYMNSIQSLEVAS